MWCIHAIILSLSISAWMSSYPRPSFVSPPIWILVILAAVVTPPTQIPPQEKKHQLPQLHRHGPTLILLSIRMHGHIFPLPFTPQPIANNIFQDQPLIVSHNCHTTNHVQSYISSFTSFFCAIITITVSVIPHAKITFTNSHFFVKATTTIAINGTLVLLLYPPLLFRIPHLTYRTRQVQHPFSLWYDTTLYPMDNII